MIDGLIAIEKAVELASLATQEQERALALEYAQLSIASALMAIYAELHEMNKRADVAVVDIFNAEPVDIISEFLGRAEAAVKERDEPKARRCLKGAVAHRESIMEGDAALNNKLKLLDERIKFVWRWMNSH